MSTTWRPHPGIRPIAIGVVRRGPELLVVAVCDDTGRIKGTPPASHSSTAARRYIVPGSAPMGPRRIREAVLVALQTRH